MPTGTLYLVGTPIGNLKDITLRALEVLRACDVIYCEDTRHSLKLLSAHGISKPTSSFHQFSDDTVVARVRDSLLAGKEVAYITDAGMPGCADPGPELVAMCRAEGLAVDVIPGPSALATALAYLPVHPRAFTFMSFPGKKRRDLEQLAEEMTKLGHPCVVFIGPHDLPKLAEVTVGIMPEATQVLVCRELTKLFQDVRLVTLAGLVELAQENPRGELTLIFLPPEQLSAKETGAAPELEDALKAVSALDLSARDKMRVLTALFPSAKAQIRDAVYNKEARAKRGSA